MAKTNVPRQSLRTHEGAKAKHINHELQLRRSVMACLLWEKEFYEEGVDIAGRVAQLIPLVDPEKVAEIAIECREKMKIRHTPLFIVREMAKLKSHQSLVAATLERVIQRADELSEFLAIYWKDKRQPLSAQVKKGLAAAFCKFSEYDLAKYNRDGAVKLRDVLFLSHAKPRGQEQELLWKRLVNGELAIPDTWEVALSSGADKKATWTRLIAEGKLGALAFLRNLRNMQSVAVDENVIRMGISRMKTGMVLPFRFIAAAKYAPTLEDVLETSMFKCLDGIEKLPGRTMLLIDNSGSMDWAISSKSDLTRYDAACGLAILASEVAEQVKICTFNTSLKSIPPRRGFALRDALGYASGGTCLGAAIRHVYQYEKFDRLIVLTDEQSHDSVPDPQGTAYMINIASNGNGVGYGKWVHIDGWSESVISYITECEKIAYEQV